MKYSAASSCLHTRATQRRDSFCQSFAFDGIAPQGGVGAGAAPLWAEGK